MMASGKILNKTFGKVNAALRKTFKFEVIDHLTLKNNLNIFKLTTKRF